jgi:uroporphyrinogen decarboxylase
MGAVTADHLNARERVNLLLIDERPDRVPAYPFITHCSAGVTGIDLETFVRDGEAHGAAQIAAFERYGHDFISVFTVVGMMAEAMGSEFSYSPQRLPVLATPAVRDADDIGHLRIPDPERHGHLPQVLAATEYAYRRVTDIAPIMTFIAAPFSTAALLRSPQELLVDTITNPDLVRGLLDAAFDATLPMLEAIIEVGGLPVLVDPLASSSVVSPAAYRRFALPYEKRLIEFLHRWDLDIILHICGRTDPILEDIATTGADLVSLDVVDFAKARGVMGERIRLIGNVSPANVMLRGGVDDVERSVRACMDIAKTTPRGYVAATGCEIPMHTPPQNIDAFTRTVRETGAYWEMPEW